MIHRIRSNKYTVTFYKCPVIKELHKSKFTFKHLTHSIQISPLPLPKTRKFQSHYKKSNIFSTDRHFPEILFR